MKTQITDGIIQSWSFPQENFGYTAHGLLVPPFPPSNALIIGYGQGTVAGLIKLIWGTQVEIMGVDLVKSELNGYDDFWCGDANAFVKKYCLNRYDFVVIDLYNGRLIPTFVFEEEFVKAIAKITRKLLAVNITFYKELDFGIYGEHFIPDAVKTVNQDRVLFLSPKSIDLKV